MSFAFPYKLFSQFVNFYKKILDFWLELHEIYRLIWDKNEDLKNIESSNPWTCLSFHLFRSLISVMFCSFHCRSFVHVLFFIFKVNFIFNVFYVFINDIFKIFIFQLLLVYR